MYAFPSPYPLLTLLLPAPCISSLYRQGENREQVGRKRGIEQWAKLKNDCELHNWNKIAYFALREMRCEICAFCVSNTNKL